MVCFWQRVGGQTRPDLHADTVLGLFEQLYEVNTFGMEDNLGTESAIFAYRMGNLAAIAVIGDNSES